LNVFHAAWKHKSLLLLGTVCGLALAVLFYTQKAPVYQSSARVLVIKKQPDLPVSGVDSRQGSGYIYDDYIAAQVAVIRSQLIVSRAVQKAGLGRLKSFQGQGDPTAVIIGSLSASRDAKDGGGNVLDLSYRGPISDECGLILMAVIKSYEDFLDDTYRNVSNEAAGLIKQAEGVLHGKLDDDKRAYKELRLKGPVMVRGGKEGGGTVQQERLANIEGRRSALLVREAEIEGRLATIEVALKEGRDPTPLMDLALDSTRTSADARANAQAALTTALLPLMLEEQKLMDSFGKDHPDVQSVRKRIQLTQEFLARGQAEPASPAAYRASAREVDAYVQSLKRQLEEARQSGRAMAQLFEREHGEVKGLATFELEEEDLRRRIAMNEQLYDTIVKRLQEIDLVKDRNQGGYKAEILSPAGDGWKVEPRAVPVFGLGSVAGLLVGLALALLAEISDKSFRTPDEIRRRLGLPIVGHIPFLRPDEAAVEKAHAQGVNVDPLLCSYLQSKSVQAEAYRGVRTSLYFSTQDQQHKVIQITSPSKGDGKSTMAANLAVSIAQSGKSVLILDADFRRPRQHKVFGVPARLGVASVMEGTARPEDAIQPTVVSNLFVLPCGPRPANPAELLTSPRFKELLDGLRDRYDFVLIDTPPLLAVSDPSVVAPRVDGVLLTIRVSKNGRPQAERAKEMLTTLGANILGVVVNGVGRRGRDGYEDAQYGAAYGYGYAYESYEAEDGRSYYQETGGGSNPDIDLGAEPSAAAKLNGSGTRRPSSNSDVDLAADPTGRPRTAGDSSLVRRRQHSPHRGSNGQRGRRRTGLLAWLRSLWS
jgi:capsular exopolysaccharide synthesis family protein